MSSKRDRTQEPPKERVPTPAPEPSPPSWVEADEPPLIEVNQLIKNYYLDGKEIRVLKGISRKVWRGERISLTGPSGVGKSTFLHVIGTIDRPTSGKVLYQGEDVFKFTDEKLAAFRNRTIGFVFQFHHLLPDFTALENVMIPALIAGYFPQQAAKLAKKVLDDVGLSHRLDHTPGELSGGEQQRVAIARALVMKPKILLADEPTGNLDENTSEEIHNLLFQLNREYGITLILATHKASLAERLERRWEMLGGVIVRDERTPKEQ